MEEEGTPITVTREEARAFRQLCKAMDLDQKAPPVLVRGRAFTSLRSKLHQLAEGKAGEGAPPVVGGPKVMVCPTAGCKPACEHCGHLGRHLEVDECAREACNLGKQTCQPATGREGPRGMPKGLPPAALRQAKCVCPVCRAEANCLAMDYVYIAQEELREVRARLDHPDPEPKGGGADGSR